MIRYWDKAATDKSVAKGTGAHTAGVLLGRISQGEYEGCFIVLDVVRGQWAASKREQVIENTANADGKEVKIWVEQEPGSGGKESAEMTIKRLAGFKVEADRVTGEKVVRAEPYSAQQVVGNILLLKAEWNQRFIHEHGMFPVGAQKDQVDAAAGAFNKLAAMREKRLSW
jgi:predicted phage terminase large subunit-like protein